MSTRVRVRRDARLHENTVQQAERHARSFRKRKGAASGHTVGGPVEHQQVEPAVWQKAMELAEGDGRRIEVISLTVVVVHNPGWKRGRR